MTLLVIDATAVIVAGISGVVALGSLAMTLLINKNIKGYHKEVNGMKTELIQAVGEAKFAGGKEAGIAQQKAESETTASEVVKAIKDDPNIDLSKSNL